MQKDGELGLVTMKQNDELVAYRGNRTKSKISTIDKNIMLVIKISLCLAIFMVFVMDILVAKKVNLPFIGFCIVTLYFIWD